MTTIEEMARWAARLRFEDLPARVVEKARGQEASVLAASFAGRNDSGGQKLLAATRKQAAPGARVLAGLPCAEGEPVPLGRAGGFTAPRRVAALTNASLSCTFDFDEIQLLGHTGHSTVTVPLAVGEELGLLWSDAVLAQIAGNEIAGRLGFATFLGPQNGQMLPYIHCAGAAIAMGKLLDLDEERMAHALAVSLAQPPAALWPSFLGPIESKLLVGAHGTVMGMCAAELAAEGFVGSLDLLDHPRGFFHRFSFVPIRRALAGLGRCWLSDTLQVKLHAACWYYQALLDGLLDTVPGPLSPDAVKRLHCRVTFLAHSVDAMEGARGKGPLMANEVNFSIATACAMGLLLGRLHPNDLTPATLAAREAEVRALADKITVEHDIALSARMIGALDDAVDLAGLFGDVSLAQIASAGRKARHEFPHAGNLEGGQILALLKRAPKLIAGLLEGKKREHDLGAHDLSNFVLQIPAAFTLELADGRVIEGARDVPAGALGLPDAAPKVERKLRESLAPFTNADAFARALAAATPDTKLSSLLSQLS